MQYVVYVLVEFNPNAACKQAPSLFSKARSGNSLETLVPWMFGVASEGKSPALPPSKWSLDLGVSTQARFYFPRVDIPRKQRELHQSLDSGFLLVRILCAQIGRKLSLSLSLHIYIYIYMIMHTQCIYIYIYIYIYICIDMCIRVCVCVCIYIYIYIYGACTIMIHLSLYIYIYIYIYIYM